MLRQHYERPSPVWGYRPAKSAAKPVYSGEISLQAALEGVRKRGNPLGRTANTEVVELIWKTAQGRHFHCHDLKPRPFFIRKDLSILVDPLFFFVERGRVKIFWLQPRRGYAPSLEGMAALAIMVRMTFADEFDDADLELLDLRVPEDEEKRVARILNFADLPVCSEEVLRNALERFARAYDRICEAGVTRPARKPRPDDRPSGDLFDKPR